MPVTTPRPVALPMPEGRPVIVLFNALATRTGGSVSRIEEVVARAGAAWDAEIFVLQDPRTPLRLPPHSAVPLPDVLMRAPYIVLRLLEGRLVKWAARRVGATAVVHYGTYVAARMPSHTANVLCFTNMSPWGPGPDSGRRRNRIRRWLFERTAHRPGSIIIQSEAARAALIEHYPRLARRLSVVHNGCATPGLTRPPRRSDFAVVGHVYMHRRIHEVIRAYAQLPMAQRRQHRLLVIGQRDFDPEAVRLADLEVKRHGLDEQVVFTGALPRVEVLRLVAGACAFVSFAEVENGPNAVMEADAIGAPLIVTDLPVHREFVRAPFRFVASVQELARALNDAAVDCEGLARPEQIRATDTWARHVEEFGRALRREVARCSGRTPVAAPRLGQLDG